MGAASRGGGCAMTIATRLVTPACVIVLCVAAVCVTNYISESDSEVALQGEAASAIGEERSDLQDQAEMLGSLKVHSKNDCFAKVNAHNNALAARLRFADAKYKVAYKMLKREKNASHKKYLSEKESLNAQVLHSSLECKTLLTTQLEKKDPQYVSAFAKLISKDGMLRSKVKLAKSKKQMMVMYHKAIKSQAKSARPGIQARFRRLIASMQKASTYHTAVLKLRSSSSWYPKYKKQIGEFLPRCRARKARTVATALKRLKATSSWYKRYSSLIKQSSWYRKYKKQAQDESQCGKGKRASAVSAATSEKKKKAHEKKTKADEKRNKKTKRHTEIRHKKMLAAKELKHKAQLKEKKLKTQEKKLKLNKKEKAQKVKEEKKMKGIKKKAEIVEKKATKASAKEKKAKQKAAEKTLKLAKKAKAKEKKKKQQLQDELDENAAKEKHTKTELKKRLSKLNKLK